MKTKTMFFPLRMARIALAAVMALSCTLAAQATEFITDVMVIGAKTEGQINLLKVTYENKGWTVIDNDLNKGCGGNSDYVYLLYKSEENTDGLNHGYITDFYISDATGTVPDNLDYGNHTYYLVPFDGDNPQTIGMSTVGGEFKASKGDLNSGTSGVNIHLYYTREQFTDNRTASAIVFNDTKNESVVWNGNGEHADLNKGCGSGTPYIYMHVDTAASAFPGYIKEVMLIGGTGDEVNTLKTTLTAQGWKVINHDLNAGCGSSSDYIYLLYKSENSTDGCNYGYITDFYISNATGTPPDDLTYDGRTYHLVPFDGGSHFKEKKGDLNSNAGGDDIHLYYTKRLFTDKRTVTNISFKNIKSGAVGVNGGSEGYDLNKNAGRNDIFMHLTTGTTLAPFSGSGMSDAPFIINSAADWSRFVTCISKGAYVDMYYKLTANISVTEMVGTSEHPFAGHFDGDGHTLTVNINSSEMGAAPFHYVKNATIEKLTVGGTVAASAYHAAGLAGLCYGNLTITGCAVSANINASGYAGGMVGHSGSSTISISDSFYSGTISGFKNYAGGLIGWGEALTLTMTNCLFKGVFSPASGGKYHPIACKDAGKTATATVTDTYYLNSITPTATGDNIIPGAEGRPASTTCIADSWDLPVTAADGITYYLLFTGKRLPYEYGFENKDLTAEGWTMVDCYDDTEIEHSSNASHIHSGYYAFYFAYRLKNDNQYLVSPEFSGHSPILVRFYYTRINYSGFAPGSCQVGYSTTTPDIDAFTWGETNTSSTIGVWELYEGTFPKGTKYIAIKWIYNYRGVLYLDDFSFTACNTPSPVKLSVTDITEYTASPSWEAPEADYPITGYTYQYKKTSDEEWSAEATVTRTSATLSGLSANTDYQFQVKALYGEHGESLYTPVNFTTAMELPYECGFENGMARWSMVDVRWDYSGISTEAARDGEKGFLFFLYKMSQYIISPRFAGTSEMTVSFYYRDCKPDSGFEETFQVGYSTTTNDISDFTWSDDIVARNIPWTLYEKTFPVGTRYIAIKYKTDALGLYLDDFSFVEYSAYAKPTDLAVSDLTDKSAQLTWTAPDGATSYAYQYKKPTDDVWSTEATVKTTSVTLSGLEANTTYDLRVKALYGEGNASNYVTVRFLTEGSPVSVLPYIEGFENGMGGWRLGNGSLTSKIVLDTSFSHDGNNSFMLYQHEALISPQFEVSTPMLVSFYYRNFSENTDNYRAHFQVGYSTTKDLDEFEWGNLVYTGAEWQKLSIYCPAGTKYVAIKWIEGYMMYLDDFIFAVGTPPSAPHDIVVTNLTGTSADLSWSGDSERYDIRFRQTSLSNWTTVTTRNNVRFRMSGFSPETEYEFQVRSKLYNIVSDWSDVVTFTTNRLAPLYDDEDNKELINSMTTYLATHTNSVYDVMLVGRTLYKDGRWNTLCLPFGVSNLSGTPLEGAKVKTLGSTELSDDGTLTLNFTDATGLEAGKPYILKWDLPTPDLIIRSAADWEAFAQNVNNGTESYEGKLVQLGTDISISTMAGTADHPFCGIFDGAGYTLNVSINNSGADYAAPFRYISGATICNLKVTGSVNGGQYSAGIVGAALGGTNSIRDCWMAASVTGLDHVGGILGHGTTSATTISNCYLTGSLNSSYIGVLYGWGSAGGKQAVENCWARGDYPSFIIGGSINLVLTDGGTVSVTNCRQNIGEYAQGDEEKVIIVTGGGSTDTYYADFLGSQWKVDDNGSLALKHATEVSITSPVFRYVRVSNALTPVETDHVNFIGITSPATLAADDSSLLYLDTDNALHHPDADMTLNACRGYFQLNDPNATINAIVLNFDSILPGDVNGDGKVTPADAIMILYHYFNVVQNGFNVKAADLNNDGHVTPADAIEALYLYFGSSSKARATSPMVNSSCDPE